MKKFVIFIAIVFLALGVQAQTAQSGQTYKVVEQMPIFPGGDAALMKYIDSHMQFPKEAADWSFDCPVVVQFVVTKTGQVGEVKIVRSAGEKLDQEAIRLCKSLPKFVPGRQNGQPVDTWYTLPIRFRPRGPQDAKQEIVKETNTTAVTSGKTFASVEQMPTFPGGDAALMKYIATHIQYPQTAMANQPVSSVVQFVITKTGQVGDVKIVKSAGKEFDQEIMRLCKSLPKFVPGRQNGQAVDVWYTLPIRLHPQK